MIVLNVHVVCIDVNLLCVQADFSRICLLYRGDDRVSPLLRDVQFSIDVFKMKQVFRNLVSNALKFTKPGGNIYINAIRKVLLVASVVLSV